MGLDKQIVPVSFLKGIDTKTDPKQVVRGKFISLTNAIMQTTDSVRKRNGYTALSTSIIGGGSVTSGIGVSSYKNEIVELDGKKLYTYGETPLAPSFKDYCQPVTLSVTDVIDTSSSAQVPDVAYHAGSGLKCVIANGVTPSGGFAYSIIDVATGASIVTLQSINTALVNRPLKVLTLSKFFVIFYQDSNDNSLRFKYIPTDTLVLSSSVTVAAGTTNFDNTHPIFDAVVINDQIFVGYASVLGGTNVAVTRITHSSSTVGISSPALHQAGEAATTAINVFGDASNNLWVSYYNGTAVKVFISDFPTDPSLSNPLVLSPTVVETVASVVNITGIVTGTTGTIFYEISAAAAYNHLVRSNTLTTAGVVGTAGVVIRSLGLTSKSFVYNGDYFFVGTYGSSVQPTYFLFNVTQGQVTARIASGLGAGPTSVASLAEVITLSSTSFMTALLKINQSLTLGGTIPVTITNVFGVETATFTFMPSVQMVESANVLHISGGFLWAYDGTNVSEQGFHLYPETPTLAASGSDGFLSTGSYQYIVVYTWIDGRGQVNRSAPSIAGTVSVSALNHVLVTLPNLRVTQKTNVLFAIYRTTANGTIFYRLDPANTLGISSSKTTDTTTFTDISPDSTIIAQEELYTTGGEVDNFPGPPTSALCSYKNRLVVIPSEVPYTWWFSKEILPGSPSEFSNLFVQNETANGGAFTAVAQMDDKLVLFKTANPYYVVGTGPAPNGVGNDFTPAQILVSDVGCTNVSSVLLIDGGLTFQSAKGLCLLSRSLGVDYFGMDVETYSGQTVTSAVLVSIYNQARFTLSNGIAIVYDYTFKDERGMGRWDTFTNHSAVSATLFQGNYTYLQSGGTVMQEAVGTFTDNGTGIQMSAQTSWLSLAGLQGFQRIYKMLILGQYKSAHTLQVQVAYDFNTAISQTDNISASATLPYQYRINFARQKCEAIQLIIQDTTPTAEDMSLSAMTFEVGIRSGTNRMAPTRSFG